MNNPALPTDDELRLLADIFRIRSNQRQGRSRGVRLYESSDNYRRIDDVPFGSTIIKVTDRNLSDIYDAVRSGGEYGDFQNYLRGYGRFNAPLRSPGLYTIQERDLPSIYQYIREIGGVTGGLNNLRNFIRLNANTISRGGGVITPRTFAILEPSLEVRDGRPVTRVRRYNIGHYNEPLDIEED